MTTFNPHPIDPASYNPPWWLRHPDVQNIASSIGLRTARIKHQARGFFESAEEHLLDGGDGVRLASFYSPQPQSTRSPAKGLVTLLHGWEGCSESAYVMSAAVNLYKAGYSVLRLNMRDHGATHHLNEGLFNSTLTDEVANAISCAQQRWPHQHNALVGYSLGGNFALRIAIKKSALQSPASLSLDQVIAVCPVIDPAHSLRSLESGRFFYHHYFVRRWKNSLMKKLQYFPEYGYSQQLQSLNNLRDLHDFFVPNFTPFKTRDEYFSAYAVAPQQLATLAIPTTIINSEDDPITRVDALPRTVDAQHLSIKISKHGAHCAFIEGAQLTSWIDRQLVKLLDCAIVGQNNNR